MQYLLARQQFEGKLKSLLPPLPPPKIEDLPLSLFSSSVTWKGTTVPPAPKRKDTPPPLPPEK